MGPHAGQPVAEAGARLGQARAVAILMHGRNATPASILGLVPRIARPNVTYLAPAAADRTWYPHSFLTDIAGNEPGLSSALGVMGSLVAQAEAAGVPRSQVVLVGFSQGACLSAEFAIRHAARLGGVAVLSGGAIGPPGTEWRYPGSLAGTPVLLGCSDQDSHIPATRVQETAEVFSRMGASVTMRLYPGLGHTVNEDEVAYIQRLLDDLSG